MSKITISFDCSVAEAANLIAIASMHLSNAERHPNPSVAMLTAPAALKVAAEKAINSYCEAHPDAVLELRGEAMEQTKCLITTLKGLSKKD